MDVQSLISSTSNPLRHSGASDAPAPMRMSFKETLLDDRPALQRLCEASGRSEQQLVEMGDEDLLVLMEEHREFRVAAKNEILADVTAKRNPHPPDAAAAGAGAQGGGDEGRPAAMDLEALNARWEEHMQRRAWSRIPKDTILRWLAIFVFATFLYSIYADGAYHFQSATAEADEELFDWTTAYRQARLQLHGPTDWDNRRLFKTWYHIPAHHAVFLDFRLWALGGCGQCEGDHPPEVIVLLDDQRIDKTYDDLTFKRRSNYYEGAGGGEKLDNEKAASVFSYEFSAHAQELPEPAPKSNSVAFGNVNIRLPHTATNLSLAVWQSYGDQSWYATQTEAMAMQQVMLDAVRVRYGVCKPPAPQPPLPRLSRRTAAQISADREVFRAVLVAATANHSFELGQGTGLSDEFIGEVDTPEACAELVVRQRPAANGASFSLPPMHGCWAEFGMTARAIDPGSPKFVSTFIGPTTVTLTDEFGSIEGSRGWEVSGGELRASMPAETTTCGTFGEIIGGFGYGVGVQLQKTYDLSQNPHHSVSISLQFVQVDSWDGESGLIFVDGQLAWDQSFSFTSGSHQHQCGTDAYPEQAVHVGPLLIAHRADTLTLTVTSTLDQDGSDESFGISNIRIRLLGPSRWVASGSGLMKCIGDGLLGVSRYRPVCCSDQALPEFLKLPRSDRNCPWYKDMNSLPDGNLPMDASAAQRVCASQGARQCSVVEVSSAGCLPPLEGTPQEALVWTGDECERIGQEMLCTDDECQEVNFDCDTEDLDSLDVIDFIDESQNFSAAGWSMDNGGIGGGVSGGSYTEVHASHTCDDSKCSSNADDCCAPNEEPETCEGGEYTEVLMIGDDDRDDKSGACVTYTCCRPELFHPPEPSADPAPISEYSVDYLFASDSWRPVSIAEPLTVTFGGSGDDALWWTYILFSSGLLISSYFVSCKAPPLTRAPLPVYPYIGIPVGRGEYFRLSGGYENGRLDSTRTRLVLRANREECASCPGRCGGFSLPVGHQTMPQTLRERGVPEHVWDTHMRQQRTLQKRYSKLCDVPLRWSAGCVLLGECPWWFTFKWSWASNCYGCCGCCWRCCCCCECSHCCCCNCSACCCPGASGFLGIWWHVFFALVCPFIPWSAIDPYQHAMGRWLTAFNAALQPYGVHVKLFTFAKTDAEGGMHGDGNSSLATLVIGLTDEEIKIIQMEPVLQAGHHHDQHCGPCWACMCHTGRVV